MADKDVKGEIERLESERCRALNARDVAAIAVLVADDLVHIHASCRINAKAGYRHGVEQRSVGTPEKRQVKAGVTQLWCRREGTWRHVGFQVTNACAARK